MTFWFAVSVGVRVPVAEASLDFFGFAFPPVIPPKEPGDGAEGSIFFMTRNDAITVVPPGK